MVQGLATDHLGWMLQVPELPKHYRVITFDNRDVGQSKQADGPYEIADMARDALNMERPDEFNELLLGWLRANGGRSDQQERGSAQPTPS